MNPGLVYLLRKSAAGKLRYLRRRMRGPKGVLVTLGFLMFLFLIVAPQVPLWLRTESPVEAAARANTLRTWAPLAVILFALIGMFSGRAIYFRASEVNFLFPAPLGRREVLLYHVLGRLEMNFLLALWLGIFFLRHSIRWYYGLPGLFLTLAFTQLLIQLGGLSFSSVAVRVGPHLRRILLPLLALLVAAGVFLTQAQRPAAADLRAAVRAAAESPAAWIAAFPARMFVEIFVAGDLGAFLSWTAGGCAILCALFYLVVGLDVAYEEGAVQASRDIQRSLRTLRSGGGAFSHLASRKARFSLPQLPRLGGAGPVAWRQLVAMTRNPRGFLMFVLLLALTMVPVLLISGGRPGSPEDERGELLPVFLLLFMSLLMSQNLAFDFRGDLDRMAYLKSLPLSPFAVAAGQVLPSALIFTLFHWSVLGLLALTWMDIALDKFLALCLVIPPINWLVSAIENILFLLLPYRLVAEGEGAPRFAGRAMLVAFLKVFTVTGVLAMSAIPGVSLYLLLGSSLIAGASGMLLGTTLACVLFTWLTGRTFRMFDLSKDVPG